MSATATLFQTATALPYDQVVKSTAYAALLGGIALFFRPLLVGIGRALFLTVRPRRTRAQLVARQAVSDALALQRAALHLDAVDAAEVRAMACRH